MAGLLLALSLWPTPLTAALGVVAVALLVTALERARLRSSVLGQDLFYVALSGLLAGALQALGPQGAPSGRPFLLDVLLGLLLSDLCSWLSHRLLHRVPWLWRLHAVHHALPELHGLNALHNHPLDALLSTLLGLAPLWLLGLDASVVGAVGALSGAQFWWQHAALPLSFGALDRLFVSPRLHLLHHARDPALGACNYGMVFSLWDALAGTLTPVREAPFALGVEHAPARDTLLDQLRFPSRFRP